jgi:hypothetical protein
MTKEQYEAEEKRVLDAILEGIRRRTRAEWIEMIERIESDEPFKLWITKDQIRPSSRKKRSEPISRT